MPLLPLRLLLPFLLTLQPAKPLEWWRFVRNAKRHGRVTPPLSCVDYGALLPLPLDEVRRRIGVPSLADAHPGGLPVAGALLRAFERRVTLV